MTHMDKAHPAINGRDVVEAWEARGGAFTAGGGAAKLVQEANHALGGARRACRMWPTVPRFMGFKVT
jgi:hypothetical protein